MVGCWPRCTEIWFSSVSHRPHLRVRLKPPQTGSGGLIHVTSRAWGADAPILRLSIIALSFNYPTLRSLLKTGLAVIEPEIQLIQPAQFSVLCNLGYTLNFHICVERTRRRATPIKVLARKF